MGLTFDCHVVMRKYTVIRSAYTEAEILYKYISYMNTKARLALFITIRTLI